MLRSLLPSVLWLLLLWDGPALMADGIIPFLICIFTFFKINLLVSVCFCLYVILISPRLTKYLVSSIRICVGAVANLYYALSLNGVNTGLSLVRTTVEM